MFPAVAPARFIGDPLMERLVWAISNPGWQATGKRLGAFLEPLPRTRAR